MAPEFKSKINAISVFPKILRDFNLLKKIPWATAPGIGKLFSQ